MYFKEHSGIKYYTLIYFINAFFEHSVWKSVILLLLRKYILAAYFNVNNSYSNIQLGFINNTHRALSILMKMLK